jgi:predicted  nucleic acid-binding Zn-ribbon protein
LDLLRWGPEVLALSLDKEFRMDAPGAEHGQRKYKTPRWVQAWFLGRSRDRWKQKYKDLKVEAKRLQNRVADVTKSREKWRQETEALRQRLQALEAENAVLHEQAAALKKDGPASPSRPGR